jgi:hypothetical protein
MHTAYEGPERIQYKCMVPIYVFSEMKLRGLIHVHICELLYIPRIGLLILMQANRQPILVVYKHSQINECRNWE